MSTSHDHAVQLQYNQLQWIDHRRIRIIDSVAAHFSKSKVHQILKKENISLQKILPESRYQDRLGSLSPTELIQQFARQLVDEEAKTITVLRNETAPFPPHVEEQMLFGAQNAGQDAGRHYLSHTFAGRSYKNLALAELVHAVMSLNYNGSADDKDSFLSLRPLSDASIHYRNCHYVRAWKYSSAELAFYSNIQAVWVRGIIDVLSPDIIFQQVKSIAKGNSYGLETFTIKQNHA